MIRRGRLAWTAMAIAAALPELVQYAGYVRRGDYPGSAYAPRVDATLLVSDAALQGGPFATIPAGGRFSVAPGLLNDLGVAAVVDVWTRLTAQRSTVTTLGVINLVVMAASVLAITLALAADLRIALVPVFLLAPLAMPLYRSADVIAIHGALALLSMAVGVGALRAQSLWRCGLMGALLFGTHALRSVYGFYGLMALAPGLALRRWRFPDPGLWRRLLCFALCFAACEGLWQVAMIRRLADPRLVERDALPAHNVYEPLVSGIGWTPNPWGIKPQDPWVAAFLAERVGGEPVSIASVEGERRAKTVYFELARERPWALASLYLGRVPGALRDYSLFGAFGAVACGLSALAGLALGLRRGDAEGTTALAAVCAVAAGLLLQIVVIDTRPIYAYPFELVSATMLSLSLLVLWRNRRLRPQ